MLTVLCHFYSTICAHKHEMTNVTLSFPAVSFVIHTHINPIRLRKMPTCLPFPSCVLCKEHFNLPYQFKIFERFYVLSSLIEFSHLQPKRPARTWFCGHKSILLNYLMHNTFRSCLSFSCNRSPSMPEQWSTDALFRFETLCLPVSLWVWCVHTLCETLRLPIFIIFTSMESAVQFSANVIRSND